MLVQMLWGFQFVECLKQFERKISFSMLSNILKMKKNVMKNSNIRPNAIMQKAAEATGVPLRTLQRLSNANSESKKIKCKKAKLSRENFGKLDDFDLGVVRRLIHQFYLRNESPTLDKILKELKEKMEFPYGRSCLHKLLKKIGFSFKFRGKERLIYERSDIIADIMHLRAITKFRENNPDQDIVYTDETWLNQGHRTKKEWVNVESLKNLSRRQPGYNDLTIECTKPSTGKGGRVIISDAMTDKGLVDGSLWIFKADQGKKPNKKIKKPSKDCNRQKEKECAKQENEEEKMDESNSSEGILWQEDYHDSMNGDSYEQYFANSLCTNVPQGSLIVIDNAPYHSRNDETYPISKWKKQQYIDWLKSKDIAVPKKILRAELWTMCKQERDCYPAKIVESIAKNAGHETLCLPPHHCQLNPIEMVWGVLKNYVATENKDMTLKSVEELFRKRHAELKDQPEFWKKCVEKVKRIEEDYRKSENQLIFKLKSCVLNYILIA